MTFTLAQPSARYEDVNSFAHEIIREVKYPLSSNLTDDKRFINSLPGRMPNEEAEPQLR